MKKLLTVLLITALCLSCLVSVTPQVSAVSQTGTDEAAAVMKMMGALQGDDTGTLNLSGTLTRAQFCKIAVVVMGLSDSVGQYSGYTVFPDVPSTNWASGYINLAVRSAGIITGYTNGEFGPEDIITYGQAVTVLVKMLGYTTADAGAKWPDGFIAKADDIGLTDGVSLSADSAMSRGDAAVLFVNLLNTDMKETTKTFMESLSGVTVLNDVFLVSADAETDDGTTGAVQVSGAASGTYLPVNSVPDTLRGAYGTLVLNAAGKALVLVPEKSGRTLVSTVSGVTASAITCADGTKITIPSTANFYMDGTLSEYADDWINIEGGMLVSAYYSEGGAVQCVLVTGAGDDSGNVTVVTGDTYAFPAGAAVYLNGKTASAADIGKYDVITESGGVYSVTRKRVTGRYDDAAPNTDAPATVKVLCTEFTVLDSAVSSLSNFGIGQTITLLLTADNKVADAVSGTALTNTNYGVVTDLKTNSATVTLANGITVSGSTNTVSTNIYNGSLVSVFSYDADSLALSSVYDNTNGTLTLNVADGTLGSLSLSKAVRVYECVGKSAVSEIALDDIPTSIVEAAKVRFYATDPAGRVSLLLLDDVTGDLYTYGYIDKDTVTENSGSFTVTNVTTTVTNSDGTTEAVIGDTGLPDGTLAGIAPSLSGTLAGYTSLTVVKGVSRQDFLQESDGTMYVETSDGLIPVADSVQCYIKESESWSTLSKARSYSDDLNIYYDKTPAAGGKVRVVIAN